MTIARIALIALAALRLTRFITTDFLGEWTLVGPLKRWAWEREGDVRIVVPVDTDPMPTPDPSWGWRSKLVKGLDCGYCLSPWLFGGILIVNAITSRIPVVRTIWTWLLATLAGSYAIGHTWNRLDNR